MNILVSVTIGGRCSPNSDRFSVIIDTHSYENSTLDIETEPNSIVFTGLYTHMPNSQGAIYFLDKIFPLILKEVPEAKISFVGKSPTREMLARASDNVIITGFVDDVRPYMAKARVFVIPLLNLF